MEPSPRLLFTVLACLTLAAVLALSVLYFSAPPLESMKHMRTAADIQILKEKLQKYMTQNDSLPGPENWPQVVGPIPKDPWGSVYIYRLPGKRYPKAYDLFSAGPDGTPDTPDDDWGETPKQNKSLDIALLALSGVAGFAGGVFSIRCFRAKTWGKRFLVFLPVFVIVAIEALIISIAVAVLIGPKPGS